MITVPRNPYQLRPCRSSSPDSYSSISQMGDFGDTDSFKSTNTSVSSSKFYPHTHSQESVCFNSLLHSSSINNNNNNNSTTNISTLVLSNNCNSNSNNCNNNDKLTQRNINNININNHHPNNNNNHHPIISNCSEVESTETHRTPLTISRSYSSNSSIASNDSFNKEKRRPPQPPKGHIMYHPSRYKTELCRQWEELGYCEYDDRCLFAHGIYELKPLPNRHPKYKTEKCSAFHEQGFCSFGPRCSFIHSKVDPADLLEKVLTNLPKIPMPENPEEKDNYNSMYNLFMGDPEDPDDGRLPIFRKIAPACNLSSSTTNLSTASANTSTGSMSSS